MTATTLEQSLFKTAHPPLLVRTVEVTALTPAVAAHFFSTNTASHIGLAGQYGTHCRLTALALANAGEVLIVRLGSGASKKGKNKGKPSNSSPSRDRGCGVVQGMLTRAAGSHCHPNVSQAFLHGLHDSRVFDASGLRYPVELAVSGHKLLH